MGKGTGRTNASMNYSQISENISKLSTDWRNTRVINTEKIFAHSVASSETQKNIEKVIDERGGFGRFGVIKPTETVKEVNVHSLHPTEDMVSSSNVKNIAFSALREGIKEMPTAVRYNGKIYVMNGHARVAAAIVLNQKSIKLRIL